LSGSRYLKPPALPEVADFGLNLYFSGFGAKLRHGSITYWFLGGIKNSNSPFVLSKIEVGYQSVFMWIWLKQNSMDSKTLCALPSIAYGIGLFVNPEI
jgi:hypothetical protein